MRLSRRKFFQTSTAAAAVFATTTSPGASVPQVSGQSFPLTRVPDSVTAWIEANPHSISLQRDGRRWSNNRVAVRTEAKPGESEIHVNAPGTPLTRIQLRWKLKPNPSLLFLGDAWERSYGDLAWRSVVPERVLPWYFATHDASTGVTDAYGVKTGAGAFCFWQVDPAGVSLWLDVSNGGLGVILGERELHAATIVTRSGQPGEHSFGTVAALCKLMCPTPRLPEGPVYGTNDWYYAYGRNTEEGILRDTDLVASLAPKAGVRPFSVIDMGWEGNPTFPDMARLAEKIRQRGARPGIWIRPTLAPPGADPRLLLPMKHFRTAGSELAYDPTIPEALDAAVAKLKQVVGWKYELVKHDFSTFDLLGQWGFEMGAAPATEGWSFHDRSRTNAEIILDYYKALRAAAGDRTLLLGCNTVSHLAAGVFEMQRTGDDTSGKIWERTRRMGINTLAFRLPQDRTLYALDADCVGITRAIPWDLNRQWLDLLARSGTGLFISPDPDAIKAEQRAAIQAAFAIAAADSSRGRPADWFRDTTPQAWEFKTEAGGRYEPRAYDWFSDDGAFPYTV